MALASISSLKRYSALHIVALAFALMRTLACLCMSMALRTVSPPTKAVSVVIVSCGPSWTHGIARFQFTTLPLALVCTQGMTNARKWELEAANEQDASGWLTALRKAYTIADQEREDTMRRRRQLQ